MRDILYLMSFDGNQRMAVDHSKNSPLGLTRRQALKGVAVGASAVGLGGLATGVGGAQDSGLDLPLTTVVGESGTEETDQDGPGEWHSVDFSNPLAELLNAIGGEPIVTMGPPSYRGSQPVHIRLQNVTTTGFEYKLEEWDYQDGSHTTERIYWTAIVPIVGEIPTVSGAAFSIETGTVSTDQQGTSVEFNLAGDLAFDDPPVVIAQAQTYNGPTDSIVTRVDSVDTEGFNVRVQEQEASSNFHRAETIGYIAIDSSAGGGLLNSGLGSLPIVGDVTDLLLTEFEARRSSERVGDSPSDPTRVRFRRVNDGDGFDSRPNVVASMQTRNGPQPAGLRYTNLNRRAIRLFVEEEQSADSETSHAGEDVGVLALNDNGLFPATIIDLNL